MLKVFFACLVLACAAAACASGPPDGDVADQPSALCQVLADTAAFNDREVIVRGVFMSDYQHGSLLIDPSCDNGLTPIADPDAIGEELLSAALCSEAGGLVEVSARGRVESRPGQVPSVVLRVAEYSEPLAIAFDPSWDYARGLELESRMRWDGRRWRICLSAGFIDPETRQRREPPQ